MTYNKFIQFFIDKRDNEIIHHCFVSVSRSLLDFINFCHCGFQSIENYSVIKNCFFYECVFNKSTISETEFDSCTFIKCSFIDSKAKYVFIKDSKFEFCRFDFSEGYKDLVEFNTNNNSIFFGAK